MKQKKTPGFSITSLVENDINNGFSCCTYMKSKYAQMLLVLMAGPKLHECVTPFASLNRNLNIW